MLYFDPDYLSQYLSMNVKLKVFVDGKYLSISDISDIEDSMEGVGYRADGSPATFDYRSIEHIKVGNNILTLDALEKKISGEDDTANTGEDAGGDEMGGDMPDMGGDMPDMGGGPPEGGDDDVPKESVRKIIHNMILESNRAEFKRLKIGMLVENIDSHSQYFGSKGIINKIYDNGMIAYISTNSGRGFRSSQRLFAEHDELREMT